MKNDKKMSQKEAVEYFAVKVLKDRGVEYALNISEPIKDILNSEDKFKINDMILNGIVNGEIEYSKSVANLDEIKKYITGLVSNFLRKSSNLNQGLTSDEIRERDEGKHRERLGDAKYLEFKKKVAQERFDSFHISNPMQNIFTQEKALIYQARYSEDLDEFSANYFTLKENLKMWEKSGVEIGAYFEIVCNMLDLIERRIALLEEKENEEEERHNSVIDKFDSMIESQENTSRIIKKSTEEILEGQRSSLMQQERISQQASRDIGNTLTSVSRTMDELNTRHRIAFWNNGDYKIKE